MGLKRRYSDVEKAGALLVLEACEGNYSEAAMQTGIPIMSLHDWSMGKGVCPALTEIRNAQRPALADMFESVAYKLTAAALGDDDRIERASVRDLLIGAGIAVDKMRLLREQPTDIHAQQMT